MHEADDDPLQQACVREKLGLLEQLDDWLELPMLVLAFVWLALFIVEVVWGLSPLLRYFGYAIWVAFALDFALEFWLAPDRRRYLLGNWLKALALLAPALRVLRIFRVLRLARVAGATRGVRLLRVVSSLNRGLKALRASMGRRRLGFVLFSTLLVMMAGAAGMMAFENDGSDPPAFDNYGVALWWTAMILVTLGSDFWPQTAEGRILCLGIALYGFAVFGYVTAALASFFIGRDAEDANAELAGRQAMLALRDEIAALREELHRRAGEGPPVDRT